MKPIRTVVAITMSLAASLMISGCGSPSKKRLGWASESFDYPSSGVDSAAYGADGFTFRKEQVVREPNDFMFYYKHCALSDNNAFYSKTSYWCTDP